MRIKTTDEMKTFLVNYKDMFDDMQENNYYDEANNKTYTNGFRSIYKYCKKYQLNFRKAVLDLYFDGAFILNGSVYADNNKKTDGIEII
tara:strand:- start:1120 stop:1386 length:267 start_codon:yes stop_codon:yes gene_type:complete